MILTGGRLYAPDSPGATAIAVSGHRIVFVGEDEGARRCAPGEPEIALGGRLVTPAFVDAHLHAVQTGQVMAGLDLHDVSSRAVVLDRIAAYAARSELAVIIGQGWDERDWPDPGRRRAPLDQAGGGRPVYLARIDVHSAVVSSQVFDRCPGIEELPGYRSDGLISRDAHHVVRGLVNRLFSDADRRSAARRALTAVAAQGVARCTSWVVHTSGRSRTSPGYARPGPTSAWTLSRTGASWPGIDRPGARRGGGRTGRRPVHRRGHRLPDRGTDRAVRRCTPRRGSVSQRHRHHRAHRRLHPRRTAGRLPLHRRRGGRCGVDGFRRAAQSLGPATIRAGRHRLEHAEMVAAADLSTLAELGVGGQRPAFDALWGRPESSTSNGWAEPGRAR